MKQVAGASIILVGICIKTVCKKASSRSAKGQVSLNAVLTEFGQYQCHPSILTKQWIDWKFVPPRFVTLPPPGVGTPPPSTHTISTTTHRYPLWCIRPAHIRSIHLADGVLTEKYGFNLWDDEWIRTVDLWWCQKWPFYQLRHNTLSLMFRSFNLDKFVPAWQQEQNSLCDLTASA